MRCNASVELHVSEKKKQKQTKQMESNDFEPVLFCSVISSLFLVRSIYAFIGVCVSGIRASDNLFAIKVPK